MSAVTGNKMHKGKIIDQCGEYDILDCEICGFVHIDPIPTEEELENVYKEEYYSVEKPLYLERAKEDLDWWDLVYRERYDTFEENLPPEHRHILDVGSGPGYFLMHGKQRGWQTKGIEPSKQAAEHSITMGLDISNDFLNKQTAAGLGKFDVIHMSEVLEHLPDPTGMVSLSNDLLNPGGLLCIVTPNDYNPFQHALRTACGYEPWWLVPPHHINYFNFNSLSRLLINNGFEVILRESTFPIDMFLLMGDNYIGNDALGRQCHGKRKLFEKNLIAAGSSGVKQKLYQKFAEIGIGREVQIFGRKK